MLPELIRNRLFSFAKKRKKIIYFAILAILLAVVAFFIWRFGKEKAWFVGGKKLAFPEIYHQASTGHVFYVSPSGDDNNPGTTEAVPFKTLSRAQEAVRAINDNMTEDIIVYLREGAYVLTSSLSLDPADSGTNGFNIVWRNYPDETPIISGGKTITGWTQAGDQPVWQDLTTSAETEFAAFGGLANIRETMGRCEPDVCGMHMITNDNKWFSTNGQTGGPFLSNNKDITAAVNTGLANFGGISNVRAVLSYCSPTKCHQSLVTKNNRYLYSSRLLPSGSWVSWQDLTAQAESAFSVFGGLANIKTMMASCGSSSCTIQIITNNDQWFSSTGTIGGGWSAYNNITSSMAPDLQSFGGIANIKTLQAHCDSNKCHQSIFTKDNKYLYMEKRLKDLPPNLWKANVGTGLQTRQLFVNGRRAVRARSTAGLPGSVKTEVGFTTTDSSMQHWGNISDIELVYYKAFRGLRCGIQSISGNTITMKQDCWDYSKLDFYSSHWIENAFELLDTSGEWYLDRTAGWLYYLPRPGEDMTQANVVVPVLEVLIRAEGPLGQPVHNLVFEGLTFAYTTFLRPSTNRGFPESQANIGALAPYVWGRFTRAAVELVQTKAIQFKRNSFIRLGGVGLSLENGSKDNVVSGNHFTDISATAVQVGDPDKPKTTDDREVTRGNKINNNYIHGVANEYECGVGIWLGYVQNSEVNNNILFNLPYTAISIGWGWGHQDPSVAKNNKIQNNLISDIVNKHYDGGAVYSIAAQPGNIYSGNVIIGQVNEYGAIYLDDRSRYIKVADNVVFNNKKTALFKGGDHIIQDNWWQNRYANDIWWLDRTWPSTEINNHIIFSLSQAPVSIISSAGPAPQGLNPSGNVLAGQQRLSWDSIPGASKYFLRIDDLADPWDGQTCSSSGAEGDICINDLTTISYTYNFQEGHNYKWWVHAFFPTTNISGPESLVEITVSTPTYSPSPAPSSPYDLDLDGKTALSDFLILLPNWGSTTYSNGDFDDSGKIDVSDLVLLLANWG